MANATYTKLNDGTWGIRVAGKEMQAGWDTLVSKRDGSIKNEVVSKVVWVGVDKRTGETVTLCAIQPQSRTSVPRSTKSTVGGWTCTDRAGCRCHDCL